MAPSQEALLSPAEFRARLGNRVGRNTVYDAIRAGRIRAVRVGRKILILPSEVHEWPIREAERTHHRFSEAGR